MSSTLAVTEISEVDFLTPLAVSIKEGIEKNLPTSSSTTLILMESSAVSHLFITTLRNFPYIMFGSQFKINDFCHFFSSRVSYLESTLIASACFIHNFAMSLIWTGITLVTLGFSHSINFHFKKHWIHTGLSVAAIAISLIGILIPTWGSYASAALVSACYNFTHYQFDQDLLIFEEPLVQEIKNIYLKNLDVMKEILKRYTKDEYYFTLTIEKFIDERVSTGFDRAITLNDLYEVVLDVYENFPPIRNPNPVLYDDSQAV